MKGETMKSVKLVGIIGMLSGLCLSSQATMLPPGGSGLDAPQAPGTDIIAKLVTPYAFGGISGTITSWVVSDPSNPLGGLSFYYQVSESGSEALSRVSTSNFGLVPASPVDVSTITATTPFDTSVTGGVLPDTATRSVLSGTVVGFNFSSTGVLPGKSSVVLVVNTAYQGFQVSAGSVIDSSSVNVNILGPSLIPIPETSNVMAATLLLLPFGASALRIVRKRQTSLDRTPT